MSLRLHTTIHGEPAAFPLEGDEVRVGRTPDNQVILVDPSVSRRHAVLKRDGERWFVEDQGSTNGVQLNGSPVKRSAVAEGDRIKIGIFELFVGADGYTTTALPEPPKVKVPVAVSSATIVRPLAAFRADYGAEESALSETSIRRDKRKALDQAYESKIFGFLTRLARLLMTSDDAPAVLERVMAIAFEALPVDRGFILLRDEKTGATHCALGRWKDRLEHDPMSEVPVSKTMLETVMNDRVALLTHDAQSDGRLAGGESIRIHQIRSAMVAPLWSGERIFGVIQVDSPFHAGTFTEQDLDFLTALANYAAVALDRIAYARAAENERQLRSRLERYHSPAVIEEILSGDVASSGSRQLRQSHASVLFGDLVGFTTLSETAPPETVAELLEGYFTHCVDAIFAAGGTLDKFIGDCVMAFFGAPVAQADHAERAVRAALEIQRSLAVWNATRRTQGLPEAVARIAVNTGPVVVGDVGSKKRVDYTVLGTTVNIASRLESMAPPGGILIGPETKRLLSDKLHTEPMGELQLKGLQQKIAAYRVLPS
jgi:adenylate cyclase